MSLPAVDRRDFLRVTAAAGTLLLAFRIPGLARASSAPAHDLEPNAWVRITHGGVVTVIINKAEMGQGVATSLAMTLAEELDADWSKVGYDFAPIDPVYAHPGYGIQMTGGSTSTLAMSLPMRKAGAAARAVLLGAAAKKWGVLASELRTDSGKVFHDASQRSIGYGELIDDATGLSPPADPPLKEKKDFRIIGKPTHRLDSLDKAKGTATFSIDVKLPGMLTALVAHPPTFGGKAKNVRSDAARAVRGVQQVVDVGTGVAVIASGFWPAKMARDLLEIEWDLGPHASLSSEELRAQYRNLAQGPGLVARKDGDPAAALASAKRVLEAEYELPYLAHAPMEPLNCVVDLREGAMDVWVGTQFPTIDHAAAAAIAKLPPEKVKLHTTLMGGGFGRRANPASDFVVEAVKIAKVAGAPVKLVWTREDDVRAGYYRPMGHSRVRAGLDASGALAAWSHTIVGQSILAGTAFESFLVKEGIDGTSVEGAVDFPYAVPNVQVDLHTTSPGVPVQWWRSVGHSHTAFVVESFLDEVASASGKDPLALRRMLLAKEPRKLAVLELAAAKAGWGSPPPAGRARGLAVHHCFESTVAMVAEVSLERGRPRVHKMTCAVDCGSVVNPDTVIAQVQGGVGFGLTAVLYGEITLRNGRVEQSNFHDYRMLRIHEMPAVEVHVVPSEEPSTGIGEPGVPPVAPAVANALFALTGKRIRRLPIRDEDLRG